MNTLSWLIYLAGVTGSLSGFAVFIAVVFGLMAVVTVIVFCSTLDSSADGVELFQKKCKGWFSTFMVLMIFMGTLAALIPSRQTVLLIAASQMGEQVLNHPRVNEVVNPGIELLTTWMQKETADLRRAQEPTPARR